MSISGNSPPNCHSCDKPLIRIVESYDAQDDWTWNAETGKYEDPTTPDTDNARQNCGECWADLTQEERSFYIDHLQMYDVTHTPIPKVSLGV